MITEIATFIAVAGKEDELGQAILTGMAIILQHPECLSSSLERCIEQPNQYTLTNIWTSLEAHMQDFRSGPLFPQWRASIAGLFEGQPVVLHYQAVKKE